MAIAKRVPPAPGGSSTPNPGRLPRKSMACLNLSSVHMALRASLHALRDRLTPEESAKLASQFPLLVKGVFYDGWRPGATPVKIRHRDAFLDMVREGIQPARPNANPEHVTTAVFKVLTRHVSEGEWDDIRRMLPKALRSLLPEGASPPSE